jgi:hypothetical protein
LNEISKSSCLGAHFLKKRPDEEFQAKAPCLLTFHPFNRFSLASTDRLSSTGKSMRKHQSSSEFDFDEAAGGISMKNASFNNFSIVQPISTNNILINSAKQLLKAENLKNLKISICGECIGTSKSSKCHSRELPENFHKRIPNNNRSTDFHKQWGDLGNRGTVTNLYGLLGA